MINKKILAGFIGGICFINSAFTEAAIISNKLPLLTYADHIVYTYDKPNGKKRGSIAPSTSLVMIKKINPDGSYKIANQNKRVNRWFKMSDLQGYVDFKNYEAKAYQDFTATRTRTAQSNLGHVAKNDKVIVVAEKGESKKIIFKDEGNRYRMGWIPNYVLDENASSSVSDVNTSVDVSYDNNFDTNDTNTEDIYNDTSYDEINTSDEHYDELNVEGDDDSLIVDDSEG